MYGLIIVVLPILLCYGTLELCAFIASKFVYPYDEFWVRLTAKGYATFFDYVNPNYLIVWVRDYWDQFIWWSVGSAFFVGFIAAIVISVRMERNKKTVNRTLLDDPQTLKNLLEKGLKKNEGIFAGNYGRNLFVSYEDRGLVIGPPATGKTNFLINQILKVADNKISFIAADIKPEICDIVQEDLIEKGYDVAIINPLKDVGICYNPLSDIEDEIQINELVLNLLPLPPKGEPVWVQAQQWYLRLALLYLHFDNDIECSLPEAFDLFMEYSSPDKFCNFIRQTDNPVLKASAEKLKSNLQSSKPEQAGYGTLFESLNFLNFEVTRKTLASSDISINDLGQKKPIALFLQFEETRLRSMGSLMSVLYGHILNCLIDNYKDRAPVALFFDEIGNLPKIEGLAEKLHTIRSRMLPTWMYWQTTAQMAMYSNIGFNGAEIILSSADLRMFFRNNDVETQKTVSSLVGVTDQSVESVSVGKRSDVWDFFDTTKTTNTTISERQVNIIEPHEVGELKQFEVVTLYRGGKGRGLATPHFHDYKKYKR